MVGSNKKRKHSRGQVTTSLASYEVSQGLTSAISVYIESAVENFSEMCACLIQSRPVALCPLCVSPVVHYGIQTFCYCLYIIWLCHAFIFVLMWSPYTHL